MDNAVTTVRRTITASETVVCAGYRQNTAFAMSPQRRIRIVDSVGSKDAFSAGLIYAYNKGFNVKYSADFAVTSCAFKHTVTKDINFANVEKINELINSQEYDVKR